MAGAEEGMDLESEELLSGGGSGQGLSFGAFRIT